MKIKTAINRIEVSINTGNYVQANAMMNKYRRQFGNRKFAYWMRLVIKNGLWETGELV